MTDETTLPATMGAAPPPSVAPTRARLPRIVGGVENGQVQFTAQCEEAHAANLGLGDVGASFADYVLGQLFNLTLSGGLPDGPLDLRDANALLQLAAAVEPQDELEAALAAQMAMLHHLALDAGRRAMNTSATLEGRALNVSQAGKLARSYAMLLDTLARHRGKATSQTVRVEHVSIIGGQTIVGAVAGGGAGHNSKVRPHERTNPRTETQGSENGQRRPALPGPQPTRQPLQEAGEQGAEALQPPRRCGGKRSAGGKSQSLDSRKLRRQRN